MNKLGQVRAGDEQKEERAAIAAHSRFFARFIGTSLLKYLQFETFKGEREFGLT